MKRRDFLQVFALAGAAAAGGTVVPPRYLRGVAQLIAGGVARAVDPMPTLLLTCTGDLLPAAVSFRMYCRMVHGHLVEVPGTCRVSLLPSPAAC